MNTLCQPVEGLVLDLLPQARVCRVCGLAWPNTESPPICKGAPVRGQSERISELSQAFDVLDRAVVSVCRDDETRSHVRQLLTVVGSIARKSIRDELE